MNTKLVREELYEDDYIFNEQEYKEFHFSQADPYWKIRSMSYQLSLNCFGDKSTITQRCQTLLFNNYLHRKPSTKQMIEVAELGLENIVQNLDCSSGKYDNISQIEMPYEDDEIVPEQITTHKYPWDVVPELAKMNKRLSYADIYKGMVPLMRNSMIFYDHYKPEDCITGVVALPYTPAMLEYLSPPQLYAIVKSLQMSTTFDLNLRNKAIDILKQKLYDLYYAVEDNPRLHGVCICQNKSEVCGNLSSQFCDNNMCKLCCQNAQQKKPCHIHDNMEQFFRYKLKTVYHFEEVKNFPKDRTLRLYCRRLVRRFQLEQIFDGLNVEWDKMKTLYHPQVNKIQYVYLTFQTQEDAARVYYDRHLYELKLEKEDVQIQCLNEGFWKKLEEVPDPENVLVIIKPLSTLQVVEEIPQRGEYVKMLHNLIQTITQLPFGQYQIECDTNPVTQTKCQRHMFVTLPDKDLVDKVYNAQPYFGALVAHKLTHIQYLPFLRYHKNQCLQCSGKKENNCIHDMCRECCSKQKYGIIECPCSFSHQKTIQDEKEEMIKSNPSAEELFCVKCTSYKDNECINNLCAQCCNCQAIKKTCYIHDTSAYLRQMIEMKPHPLARKMLQIVGEINLKFRYELLQGRYDWFRPIHKCHVQNGMIKANKDLQEVKDNGSLVRSVLTAKQRKEGQILTFQGCEKIDIWVNTSHKTTENVDKQGQSHLEYVYGEANCQREDQKWIPNDINNFRMYTQAEYSKFIASPCLKAQLQNNFDLFILGLDSTNFSARELIQDVYNRLSTKVGEIQPQHIMIIDSETIKSEIYSTPNYMTINDLDKNLFNMGRIIAVKFTNILDSLTYMTGEITVALPLSDGTTGKAIVYPSAQLSKNLMELDLNSVNLNYQSAGPVFQQMNREIKQHQNSLNNLVNQQNNKNQGKGKGKNNNNRNNNNKNNNNNNKRNNNNKNNFKGAHPNKKQKQH